MNKSPGLYIARTSLMVWTIIFLLALVLYLLWGNYQLSMQIDRAEQHIVNVRNESDAQSRLLLGEIDNQKALLRPIVMLRDNLVAIPELKIALPYNDITKTLQYTAESSTRIRVTSTLLTDHKQRQLSCSELVRIDMNEDQPFSPWEEAAGSVTLDDGRTMHILAAKAFKNDEGSTEECATEAWTQISPMQVVDSFKRAKAY